MTCVLKPAEAGGSASLAQTDDSSLSRDPLQSSPDERARVLLNQMTTREKQSMVHGMMPLPLFGPVTLAPDALVASGYVPGVARLAIPSLRETDGPLGVSWVMGLRDDAGATALPSGLALAAGWDPAIAYGAGRMIGGEARAAGFNVLLAGGVNLVRDPRAGRNFEYFGEDPLLSGSLAGAMIQGVQSNHVLSTIKHFAYNCYETWRFHHNVTISDSAAHESDLLAFELAIEAGRPGAVMGAYNRVNGIYACENDRLLNGVLKSLWRFPGWVMSDWGSVHSTEAALYGLDQQSGEQLDADLYFSEPLAKAVESDPRYARRLDDMVFRILRGMAATGLLDHPAEPGGAVDTAAHAGVSQTAAARGVVLLKNDDGLLPLSKALQSVLVIGEQADAGVLSGGGSSQVANPGGPAAVVRTPVEGMATPFATAVFHRSSPLKAIQAKIPTASVRFVSGRYIEQAVRLAASVDVVVVCATQWTSEGWDVPDLSLPGNQDDLIAAVAAANPNTVVVLHNGGPVLTPWKDAVPALLAAWYPGVCGAEAVADILFGDVNPSGRLPVTFPEGVDQLPRPVIPGIDDAPPSPKITADGPHFDFDIEGSDVGYRWFSRMDRRPLFPFGYGLSYTSFAYSDLEVTGGETLSVTFSVENTGDRPGRDTPQIYIDALPGRNQQRLIAFESLALAPGETRRVTITADRRLLANWDSEAHEWSVPGGLFPVSLSRNATTPVLRAAAEVLATRFKP